VTTDGVTIALTGEIDDAGRALIRPYVAMLEGVVTDRTTPRRPPTPAPVATPMPTPPPIPQPDFSGRIVQIDVQIVQIEREKGKDLGIEWFADGGWRLSAQATGSYGIQADTGSASQGILTTPGTGGITPSGSGGVFDVFRGNGASGALVGSVNLSNVEWVINALVRDGHAKVLATPKLTVQSGKAADFLVGGELPIVQTNALSSIVEFKRFGTQLDIAPVVVAEDAVFIALRAAVSSVDNLQRVQGVPGLRTRETSTTVTVKDGRSFAIAGLLSTESFTDDTSVPVLSKIPLMGALFRNSRTIHKDLETIIIMTPHILRAGGRTEPPGARIAPGPEIRKAISLDTNMPLPEVVTGKDGP
jgi:pilus assembly protein CpaC